MNVLDQTDEVIDATDSIAVYEKGKTWDCGCGQGIGTKMEVESLKCPSCQKVLVDEKADQREYTDETETRQMTLFESIDEEDTSLEEFGASL